MSTYIKNGLVDIANRKQNYIYNSTMEAGISGYATFADAAGTSPVDGTGGSPTVTIAASTTSPLRGSQSLLFTKDAANRQGEGFSYDFSIDRLDQGKVLEINLGYEIASGTFADDDMAFWIYDVTNAVLIQPTPYLMKNAVGVAQAQPMTFQSASNSTSYRLIAHVRSTSASAYSIRFDDISVGVQVKSVGPFIGQETAYTPTFSAGFGTPTNVTFFYQRRGSKLYIKGRFNAGTVASSTASFSLPAGLSFDSSLISSVTTYGSWTRDTTSTDVKTGPLVISPSDSNTLVYFGAANTAGDSMFTKMQGASLFTNGVLIALDIEIPIAGWGSSQVLSSDAGTRPVVAMYSTTTGSQTFTTNEFRPNINNKVIDTHNAVTTGTGTWAFTCPESGYYNISGQITYNSPANVTNPNARVYVYKSGTCIIRGFNQVIPFATGQQYIAQISGVVSCIAGDTLYMTVDAGNASASTIVTDSSGAQTFISITKVQSPQQIAASEFCAAKYVFDSTQSIPNTTWTKLQPQLKRYDTHGLFSSGTFTCNRSGIVRVGAMIRVAGGSWAAGVDLILAVRKNGSDDTTIGGHESDAARTVNYIWASGSCPINVLAGDTLEVWFYQSGGTFSVPAHVENNYVTFEYLN